MMKSSTNKLLLAPKNERTESIHDLLLAFKSSYRVHVLVLDAVARSRYLYDAFLCFQRSNRRSRK
jgi:hypothetical protein